MLRISIILFFGAACALHAQAAGSVSTSAPEIVNVGRGEVRLRPDRVSLTIGLVTRAPSAAAAGALNARRITPLLAALRRQGIGDSALATTAYNVQVTYSDDNRPVPAPRAYTARNAVKVTLNRVEDLGWIIDSALAAGATEVSDITFASSQAAAGRQRAIALAIEMAREDAAAAAAAAGGKLGGIIEMTIDPNDMGRGVYLSRLSEITVTGPGQTPMLPTDLKVVVEVRIRSAFVRSP